jgi:serine/threonine-protein kinase
MLDTIMSSSDSGRSSRSGQTGAPFSIGPEHELVGARYELLGLLGVGGMGNVYRARDIELDEIVALKTIRRELVDDADMFERLRREVKLARRVTHRNVARVFDLGSHGEDKFLTMELVEGESLAATLAREGALPVGRSIEIAMALCAGLGAAHAAGVVHRDLKPDNVLMSTDGRIVITDFGVARAPVDAAQTLGARVGTPAYMAPEQLEGAMDIDARADIYALGATLFEMMTGRRPWRGDSALAVAVARLTQSPRDPRDDNPDLPAACARIIMRCMARQPGDRYPSVADVASELSTLTLPAMTNEQSGIPTSARKPNLHVASPAHDKSVAVLPFQNLGAGGDADLADGLTDDLIDTLSMTRGLRVRPRSVVVSAAPPADAREVGRQLGVQVVVQGSFRRRADAVRLSVRVISVSDGYQLWAKRFDRPESELLLISDHVAHAVADALTADFDTPARRSLTDPLVIDLYLRARVEQRQFSPESSQRAVDLYEQALALAPGDPNLLAGTAIARARLFFFTGKGADAALEAAERATAAAPHLGDAHLALASIQLQLGDGVAAMRSVLRALGAAPGLAQAHALLGRMLTEIGLAEQGIVRLEAARDIDPNLPVATADLARAYALLRNWDGCDAVIRAGRRLDGEVAYWMARARFAIWRDDVEGAKRALAEVPDGPVTIVARAIFEMVVNKRLSTELPGVDRVSRLYESGPTRARTFFYQIWSECQAYLGNDDAALVAIESAVRSGLVDRLWLERCPVFDRLRASPRMTELCADLRARTAPIADAFLVSSH